MERSILVQAVSSIKAVHVNMKWDKSLPAIDRTRMLHGLLAAAGLRKKQHAHSEWNSAARPVRPKTHGRVQVRIGGWLVAGSYSDHVHMGRICLRCTDPHGLVEDDRSLQQRREGGWREKHFCTALPKEDPRKI